MDGSSQASKPSPYTASDFVPGWRRLIGTGAFSTVFNLKKKDGDIVTVKLYKAENKEMITASRARELKVLSMIDFKQCFFIVELRGIYMDESGGMVVGLLFENAELGNWSEFLIKYDSLIKQKGFHMFELKCFHAHCISAALAYLRSRGIIHGDLCMSNVLIFRSGLRAKLCDFGNSKVDAALEDSVIPLALRAREGYLAPEMKKEGQRSSFATDMFGFGVLLFAVFYGNLTRLCQTLAEEDKWAELLQEIDRNLKECLPFGELDEQCSRLMELVLSCIAFRPDDRPDISKVKEHLENLIKGMEDRLKTRKGVLKSIVNQELINRSDSLPSFSDQPSLTVRRIPTTLPNLRPTSHFDSLLLPSPGAHNKLFVTTYEIDDVPSGDNPSDTPTVQYHPFRSFSRPCEEPEIDTSGLKNPEGKPTKSMIRAVMYFEEVQTNLFAILHSLRLEQVDVDSVENRRCKLRRESCNGSVDEASVVFYALDQMWLERNYTRATRRQLVDALTKAKCRESVITLLNLPEDDLD